MPAALLSAAALLLYSALVLLVVGVCLAFTLKRITTTMSDAFNRLSAAVSSLATVEGGVKTTIDHLVAQLRANADAPTSDQINALADQLEASRDNLAADIVSGTAASGEPTGEPPVEVPVDTTTGGTGEDSLPGGTGEDSPTE